MSWEENSKLVLNQLESISTRIGVLENTIHSIKIETAVQNEKISRSSGFISAITGAIAAIVTGAIINYMVVSTEPKVIYKEKSEKVIVREDE